MCERVKVKAGAESSAAPAPYMIKTLSERSSIAKGKLHSAPLQHTPVQKAGPLLQRWILRLQLQGPF